MSTRPSPSTTCIRWGSRLENLPKDWKFETKVPEVRRLGLHHSRRPSLHLPGLRLRLRHECQLRAVS